MWFHANLRIHSGRHPFTVTSHQWHFCCSVTWNSLSFWCGHVIDENLQRLRGDIWLMSGMCAKNDMPGPLQLSWVHICACVSVFHADACDWESQIQAPQMIQWASVLLQAPLAGSGTLSLSLTICWEKGIILCPSLEKITQQLAHLSSQKQKLFTQQTVGEVESHFRLTHFSE